MSLFDDFNGEDFEPDTVVILDNEGGFSRFSTEEKKLDIVDREGIKSFLEDLPSIATHVTSIKDSYSYFFWWEDDRISEDLDFPVYEDGVGEGYGFYDFVEFAVSYCLDKDEEEQDKEAVKKIADVFNKYTIRSVKVDFEVIDSFEEDDDYEDVYYYIEND